MKRSTTTLLFFASILLALTSCSKKETTDTQAVPHLPATPYSYNTGSQEKMAVMTWTDGHVAVESRRAKAITDGGAELGRVIFFDSSLATMSKSCNSCHNSSTSSNPAKDFLDRQVSTAGSGTSGTFSHPTVGMEDASAMLTRMASLPYYSRLFQSAYGTPQITMDRVSDALAQYLTAMAAHSSDGSLAADGRFADPFK
jgi:cytochrome c peroxidase